MDYPTSRCCMCPNISLARTICPGIPGTVHPDPEPCRFVKAYIDNRGWKYCVMAGIGTSSFKARYQKPEKSGETGWKGVVSLPWRSSFDEAQADLNAYAQERGFSEWQL